MAKISPSFSKQEKKYLDHLKKHTDKVFLAKDDAPLEGFEYFASDAYRKKTGKAGNLFTDKFRAIPTKDIPRLLKIMVKNIKGIFYARKKSFTDVSGYLTELETTDQVNGDHDKYLDSYPNSEIWQVLSQYAWENWGVKFGFTEVPRELIFKNKAILFKYALVAIQEMDKEKINTAPKLDAGEEVLAVYNSLGLAVVDIACWLRKTYGIRCQANHPLGGLVSTVPLAVKAGMGWCGSNGLLITPEYGQRQRIAPIFIDAPIFKFTDSDKHKWIEDYCSICRRCEKACPTGAILMQNVYHIETIEGNGPARTSIDREKCYPYFNETLGCSICVKVCPFSRANGTYERLKAVTEKRKLGIP
jgi:ferredoxin